jgi:transposase
MTSLLTGQLILRTDKRNPLFTVYVDAEGDQERLHVHYGLELLEVVSADRNDPSFETLVGRLHNAGVSLRVLLQTFQSDAKTIQRWGRALRSRDAEELLRVLAGRRASSKFSPEIQAYVRARWSDLVREGRYGIGKRLRQEIQRIFGVKLSQETLRPLLGELKQEPAAASPAEISGPTIAEGLPQLGQTAAEDQPLSPEVCEQTGACAAADGSHRRVGRWKRRPRPCGVITLACCCWCRSWWPWRRSLIRHKHSSSSGWPVYFWVP